VIYLKSQRLAVPLSYTATGTLIRPAYSQQSSPKWSRPDWSLPVIPNNQQFLRRELVPTLSFGPAESLALEMAGVQVKVAYSAADMAVTAT
jgi:hypothetical protein